MTTASLFAEHRYFVLPNDFAVLVVLSDHAIALMTNKIVSGIELAR